MTTHSWRRLGDLLIARRIELGYKSRTAFAEEKGFPNTRVIAAIENAERQNFTRGSLAQVERAYGWRVGSIDSVLDGGAPFAEGEKLDSIRAAERLEHIQAANREAARPGEVFMQWYTARTTADDLEHEYANALGISIEEARQRLFDAVATIETSAADAAEPIKEGGSGDGETLDEKRDELTGPVVNFPPLNEKPLTRKDAAAKGTERVRGDRR